MRHFEHFFVTGTSSVFTVRPDFAYQDFEDIGSQSELGSLDAPKYMAAGSMLAECWFGIDGQSVIYRDAQA